jgi:hypothetical protein
MPALNATTTEIFRSVGINPTEIYNTFTALIGTAVSFGLWLIQVAWPFLLAIALISVLWGLANHYRHASGASGR